MKERLKKRLQLTPVKITFLVILIVLLLFSLDFRFLRFMELKSLDLRIASRGTQLPGSETVIAVIDEKVSANLVAGHGQERPWRSW